MFFRNNAFRVVFSPRSGRQHKAWGVSPRSSTKMSIEPAKRVTAVTLCIRPNFSAAARCAGFDRFPDAILGLTPQALCWRPLRGLQNHDLGKFGMHAAPAYCHA